MTCGGIERQVDQHPRAQLYESFGAYVRSQRQLAQLTLRQAAELARISNPYLSQIEHGLALPSVTVLSALADALQVSADTLLLRAAGVGAADPAHDPPATEEAIRHDPRLDDAQKHALLAVLSTFVSPLAPLGSPSTAVESSPATAKRSPRRRQPPKAPADKREASDHA
jgi:transcriptional regulator with XRE-family HTH domain